MAGHDPKPGEPMSVYGAIAQQQAFDDAERATRPDIVNELDERVRELQRLNGPMGRRFAQAIDAAEEIVLTAVVADLKLAAAILTMLLDEHDAPRGAW